MKDKKIEIIGLILTVLITIMVYRQAERFNNNDNERIGEILNKKELITPSEKWEFCNQLVNNSDNEDKGKILKLIIFSPIPEESKIELLKTCDFSELKFDWNEEDKNAYLNLKPNTKINIKKTLLKNSTFEDNDLSYFDLEKAILDNSNFINTNLTEANLKRASIRKCNFERANLIRTNFEYCDLRTLKNPFQNSFLWGIKLHNTKVSSTSWIDDICSNPNEDAIGSDYICKNYIIEEKERTDKFGNMNQLNTMMEDLYLRLSYQKIILIACLAVVLMDYSSIHLMVKSK